MRVLLASVTNRAPDILAPHLAHIAALELPKNVTLDLAYINDASPHESLLLLDEAGARVAECLPKPSEATYAVTETTHLWNISTFDWLAREKQRLLDLAMEEGYDAVFWVDSDLLLGPETLASLLACGKPITSAVFWTRWQPEGPPLPQVWLRHPYELNGRSGVRLLSTEDFLRRLDHKELLEVGGLGACTLIRREALEKGVGFWPLLQGLPTGGMWQGEDRTFCIKAAQAHVGMFADAWPDIRHLYRPSDLGAAWERPARKEKACMGDWISCILEALEEPEITKMNHKEHVRGRVGALKVLPEVEAAMLSTKVGEERIVKITFPSWWAIEPYRSRSKNVLLRVLDVKAGA